MIKLSGKMSWFGGPNDTGVAPDEGLALIEPSEVDKFPAHLFLPTQPPGTTGLARRLNPDALYVAARWDYEVTSREWLQSHTVVVRNPITGAVMGNVQPVDWGPHQDTGRITDLSPGLCEVLGLKTDDQCQVFVIPYGKTHPSSPPLSA